ncbi:DedA family protein [Methylocapsa palsarum]|uniref:Membrane protein DedA, SNARE-associated domain n=1 Tax=Methylocapsa palsarum TaxID=1612308 RepID=A0A1I3ZKI0_9HYPH|nr:DedA family protein [Methylocapsa palsarum]SFK44126.1 membrane protein DedA, SNARE-associated domain [Methylocapsa palsarum]
MFSIDLHSIIAQHGYWAVFFIVMLESGGLPFPGETALILAAAYAGATGNLDLAYVMAAAAAGAIIGDNIGFWIGRTFGANLLQRYGQFIHLPESRLKLGQYLFNKHGAKIVFFGRFIALLRIFAALLAGVNNYAWSPFLFYNAAGGILWAVLMGTGGYLFGDALHRVSGPLGIAALIAIVAGVFASMYVIRREERKMERRLEAAPEGELLGVGDCKQKSRDAV